jgi:hypothetical protein
MVSFFVIIMAIMKIAVLQTRPKLRFSVCVDVEMSAPWVLQTPHKRNYELKT